MPGTITASRFVAGSSVKRMRRSCNEWRTAAQGLWRGATLLPDAGLMPGYNVAQMTAQNNQLLACMQAGYDWSADRPGHLIPPMVSVPCTCIALAVSACVCLRFARTLG